LFSFHRWQWLVGLVILLALDKFLKLAFIGIDFPSALFGMAGIITLLVGLQTVGRPQDAAALQSFFAATVDFVSHRWLPCFYAPALVILPLSLSAFPLETLAKAICVVCVGIVTQAGFTGQVALSIRALTANAELVKRPTETTHQLRFQRLYYLVWGSIAIAAVGAVVVGGTPAVQGHAIAVLLLASTILGYLTGMALPEYLQRVFHPIVLCAAFPNVVAVALASLMNSSYSSVLELYLIKSTQASSLGSHPESGPGHESSSEGIPISYGPGNLLFSFLGVVILCFGFRVFEQWAVLQRHMPEIVGATASASAFSMLTTAILSRAAGIPAHLARGLVPRGATLALALPVAERIGAPLPITAAAVALTGLLGGNFIRPLMTEAYRLKDPISRGLSAAATAHGIGTAAMAAQEPEALPFAALAYVLCGIFATALSLLPPWRSLLLAITG